MSYALRSIARNTKSEIAQLLLSADTSVIFDLSANPSLTPLVWGKLWSQKPKLEVAKRLVARQLNKEQISMVLATEKRVNVIIEFVKSCRLDESTAKQLLNSPLVSIEVAKSWFDARTVPSGIEYDLAFRAGADRATRYAIAHPELCFEAHRELLSLHKSVNNELLTRFVESRPDYVEALLKDSNPALQAAALSSSHQFNQDSFYETVLNHNGKSPWGWSELYISVANHPNASYKLIKQFLEHIESDSFPSQLSYLRAKIKGAFIERSHKFPYAITRDWNLAETPEELEILEKLTLSNSVRRSKVLRIRSKMVEVPSVPKPSLRTKVQSELLENELLDLAVTTFYPTGSVGQVNELLDASFEAFGQPAWETAFGLLRSSYDGTVGELIATTKALM